MGGSFFWAFRLFDLISNSLKQEQIERIWYLRQQKRLTASEGPHFHVLSGHLVDFRYSLAKGVDWHVVAVFVLEIVYFIAGHHHLFARVGWLVRYEHRGSQMRAMDRKNEKNIQQIWKHSIITWAYIFQISLLGFLRVWSDTYLLKNWLLTSLSHDHTANIFG